MGEEQAREGSGHEGGESGFDWADSEDLTVLSVEELRLRLEEFAEEERQVSYRRRVLQGRIDLIRAEMVSRDRVSVSPEELARILMGGSGDPEDDPEGRDRS